MDFQLYCIFLIEHFKGCLIELMVLSVDFCIFLQEEMGHSQFGHIGEQPDI